METTKAAKSLFSTSVRPIARLRPGCAGNLPRPQRSAKNATFVQNILERAAAKRMRREGGAERFFLPLSLPRHTVKTILKERWRHSEIHHHWHTGNPAIPDRQPRKAPSPETRNEEVLKVRDLLRSTQTVQEAERTKTVPIRHDDPKSAALPETAQKERQHDPTHGRRLFLLPLLGADRRLPDASPPGTQNHTIPENLRPLQDRKELNEPETPKPLPHTHRIAPTDTSVIQNVAPRTDKPVTRTTQMRTKAFLLSPETITAKHGAFTSLQKNPPLLAGHPALLHRQSGLNEENSRFPSQHAATAAQPQRQSFGRYAEQTLHRIFGHTPFTPSRPHGENDQKEPAPYPATVPMVFKKEHRNEPGNGSATAYTTRQEPQAIPGQTDITSAIVPPNLPEFRQPAGEIGNGRNSETARNLIIKPLSRKVMAQVEAAWEREIRRQGGRDGIR